MPHADQGGNAFCFELLEGRIALHGDLDLAGVPALAAGLRTFGPGSADVVVDMSDLDFIDVAGLGLLRDTAVRLAGDGGGVVLLAPPAFVERMLDMLGWSEIDSLRVETQAV